MHKDHYGLCSSLRCKVNEKFKLFEKWIRRFKFKLELVYKATIHGCEKEDMWEKIKGRSEILILVKSVHNKIFGGYIKKEVRNDMAFNDVDCKAF